MEGKIKTLKDKRREDMTKTSEEIKDNDTKISELQRSIKNVQDLVLDQAQIATASGLSITELQGQMEHLQKTQKQLGYRVKTMEASQQSKEREEAKHTIVAKGFEISEYEEGSTKKRMVSPEAREKTLGDFLYEAQITGNWRYTHVRDYKGKTKLSPNTRIEFELIEDARGMLRFWKRNKHWHLPIQDED